MNLNQITIPSLDLTKSVPFYEKLGLKLIVEALPHYARFVCPDGNSTFSIHKTETLPSGDGIYVYFECENLDEEVARIKEHGVIFDLEPADQSWLWREARLKDPDGNQLILFYGGENRLNPPWRINKMDQDLENRQQSDEQQIDNIVAQFFDLFTNTDGSIPQIHQIKEIFLPNGLLINNTGDEPEVFDLEGFVRPRQAILTNGTLTDFKEWETSCQTTIHGNIAHRASSYEKSGIMNGKAYTGKGKKLMQFVRVKNRWFLSSVLWSDEG